jgi:hypothetical protein
LKLRCAVAWKRPQAAEGKAQGEEGGEESKEAEASLSKLPPPCYINALMIAAMPKRQAAMLTLMVSVTRGFIADALGSRRRNP